jgi:hypothetical protein
VPAASHFSFPEEGRRKLPVDMPGTDRRAEAEPGCSGGIGVSTAPFPCVRSDAASRMPTVQCRKRRAPPAAASFALGDAGKVGLPVLQTYFPQRAARTLAFPGA